MTKTSINNIYAALMQDINEHCKLDFAKTKKDNEIATKIKNLDVVIDIALSFDKDILDSIKYDLSINDDHKQFDEYSELLNYLNAFMEDDYHECCICKKIFKGYGNNPMPVKKDGVCCEECNESVVIPARLKEMQNGK